LQEDETLSQNLSALGAAGLQALDYLDQSQPAPDSWRSQQLAMTAQAKARSADVLLMVAAPVEWLLLASGGANGGNGR
jgi:hypothetical protein